MNEEEASKAIDALIAKAQESNDSADAMRFTQSAGNVANTMMTCRSLPKVDGEAAK